MYRDQWPRRVSCAADSPFLKFSCLWFSAVTVPGAEIEFGCARPDQVMVACRAYELDSALARILWARDYWGSLARWSTFRQVPVWFPAIDRHSRFALNAFAEEVVQGVLYALEQSFGDKQA
jgi:hypothetical protein